MKVFRSQFKAMMRLLLSLTLLMMACEEQQTNPISSFVDQGIDKDQMLMTKTDLLLTQDQSLPDLYMENDIRLTPWRDLLDGTYLISVSSPKFDRYLNVDGSSLLFFLDIQFAQNQIKVFHIDCARFDRYINPAWPLGEVELSHVQNDNGQISIDLGKFVFGPATPVTCFTDEVTIQALSLHFNVSALNQDPICGTVTGTLLYGLNNNTIDLADTNTSNNTKFKATRLTESEINAMAVIDLNRASCTQ